MRACDRMIMLMDHEMLSMGLPVALVESDPVLIWETRPR